MVTEPCKNAQTVNYENQKNLADMYLLTKEWTKNGYVAIATRKETGDNGLTRVIFGEIRGKYPPFLEMLWKSVLYLP